MQAVQSRSRAETKGDEGLRRFSRPFDLSFLIFAAGAVILLGPLLTGRAVMSDSDILLYYFPVKTAIRDMVLHGRGLLWNPFLGEGQPLAANPEHEIFYPFTWLLFVLPVAWSLVITEVAHLCLTWFGMRRFFRRLHCSEVSGLVACAAWTFGGVVISSMHFFPIFFALAWVPWLLSEIVSTRPSVTRLGVFGGLMALVGEPISCVMAAILAMAALFSRPVTSTRLRAAATGLVLSVFISAASWLPGFALARRGVRGSGFSEELANELSFPPTRLIELVIPRATGNTVPHRDADYAGWRFYPERRWPFFTGIYGGALLIPLLVAGLLERSRRAALFALTLGLSFALSLGRLGILWESLRSAFRPWRGVRFPEKFIGMAIFSAVVLLAFGLDFVRRSRRRALVMGAGLLAICAALVWVAAFRVRWLATSFPVENANRFFRGVLTRSAIVYGAMGILFGVMALGRRRRFFAGVGLLAVSVVELLASSRDFLRFRSTAEMTAAPPVIRRILQGGVRRLVDFLPESPPVPVAGADVLNGAWDRNRILGEQAIQWGVPLALDNDFDLTYLAASDRARRLMSRVAAGSPRRFAELLAGRGDGALLLWNRPITVGDPVGVAAVPNLRPEVDFVSRSIAFRGDDEFLARVRGYPGDLSRVAFVEGPSSLPAVGAPAKISIKTLANDRLEFSSDSDSTSIIRIARTNDRNWRAILDGRRWPLETVDLSLIGLRVPAGRHEIVIRYRDPFLIAGVGISLAGVALLVAITVWKRRSEAARPSALIASVSLPPRFP